MMVDHLNVCITALTFSIGALTTSLVAVIKVTKN